MTEGTTTQKIIIEPRIKLNRTSTKKYSWEIQLSGGDNRKLMKDIEELNNQLLEKYEEKKKG